MKQKIILFLEMECSLCKRHKVVRDTSEYELLKDNSEFLSPWTKKFVLERAENSCRDHLLSGMAIDNLSMRMELQTFCRDYNRVTNGRRRESAKVTAHRTGAVYGVLFGIVTTTAVASFVMVIKSPYRDDVWRLLTMGLLSTIGGSILGLQMCQLVYSYPA